MNENSPCGVIQDLLPLYKDNVCGEESRRLVEAHLRECADCARILEKLDDNRVEQSLDAEAAAVLENHRKNERRTAVTAGLVTAGVLMVPVIVCLICNLAVGHALDWFFIVLTALLAVASVTVVPMLAAECRFSKALGCFAGSLLLLLLACCLYTGGDWFFVAAIPSIFGLSLLFGPVVVNQIPLPKALWRRKILTVFLWDTLWLFGILISSAKYGGEYYWHNAVASAAWCLLLPWFIFITARYVRLHPLAKAGIITLATGAFTASINDVLFLLLLPKDGFSGGSFLRGNLTDWAGGEAIGNNVFLLIFLGSMVVGIGLLAAGIALGRKKKQR